MTRSVTVLLTALILALAGCGGGDDNEAESGATPAPTTAEETPAEETPAEEGGGDGKQLFAGTCGSCHTLADAGTSGTFGPNLDELKPDKERVLAAIKSGPGGMPENLFEGEQADTVAEYVSGAAGK